MRIRRSTVSSTLPSPSSCSSSSSSSSSSCLSSSTHSKISSNSINSSSNSTSSCFSSRRCEGLDLLVKAVYYVAGSVVGVPYIQRRVIRRRKRAVRFAKLVIDSQKDEQEEVFDCKSRSMALKTLKPRDFQRRRSSRIGNGKVI